MSDLGSTLLRSPVDYKVYVKVNVNIHKIRIPTPVFPKLFIPISLYLDNFRRFMWKTFSEH